MAKVIHPKYLLWQLQQLAAANPKKMMLVSITTGPAGSRPAMVRSGPTTRPDRIHYAR